MVKKGEKVEWRTSQGPTRGKVVETKTSDFDIGGTHLKASEDDPKVVVKSDKTGKEAGHKPSSVKKVG